MTGKSRLTPGIIIALNKVGTSTSTSQWVLKDITPHETVSEMTQYGPAYLIFAAFFFPKSEASTKS
jgi:hypothetical protein